MDLMEYQAKELFAKHGVATTLGTVVETAEEARAAAEQIGGVTVIKAQVPMAEMLTYEQHLTSATGGRGSYHMEYSHYDEVPSHLQTKIIATAKAERAGEDIEEA